MKKLSRVYRFNGRVRRIWKVLGPGLITGSSDDDPSGIATYSQAGAGFGFSTLWSAVITFPLMFSIQEMCARIGLVTGEGLTTIIKQNYKKGVLYLMLLLSLPAIILNIGADIAGMGAVANLLFPAIPSPVFSIAITALLILCIVYWPYHRIASVMKYLCLTLLAYILVPVIIKTDWASAFRSSVFPHFMFNKEYAGILVAILGTTISPYLFIWQTSMEVEDMKKKVGGPVANKRIINNMRIDVGSGMFYSNLIMYFIILACGMVLYNAGIRKIDTVEQAALALKPLAGRFSYLLFSLGVIGTGFLAIPVLAVSLSYALSETFEWKEGLDKKYKEAKPFYGVIIVSLIIGLLINFTGISPIKALIYTAVLYGLTAPGLIAIILLVSNNKRIMGAQVNGWVSNTLGVITFLLMTVSGLAMIWFYIYP